MTFPQSEQNFYDSGSFVDVPPTYSVYKEVDQNGWSYFIIYDDYNKPFGYIVYQQSMAFPDKLDEFANSMKEALVVYSENAEHVMMELLKSKHPIAWCHLTPEPSEQMDHSLVVLTQANIS